MTSDYAPTNDDLCNACGAAVADEECACCGHILCARCFREHRPEIARCPHGNDIGGCGECDMEADNARDYGVQDWDADTPELTAEEIHLLAARIAARTA